MNILDNESAHHSDELNRDEGYCKSELQTLVKFISGQEYADRAGSFTLDPEITRRAARLFPAFQCRFLRREMLLLIINVLRSEIDILLRLYVTDSDITCSSTTVLAVIPYANFEQHGDNLNLLNRLVLDMIYRENYAARTCGTMLGCSDDVVTRICEEGLTRLSDGRSRRRAEKEGVY